MSINFDDIETPAYVIDENILKLNLEKLAYVKQQTACKILLATKAYSCYHTYPLISKYLDGTTNSSLYEAKLSYETFGKDTHIYSPAYKAKDISEINKYATTIVFNSSLQYETYFSEFSTDKELCLRINPEHVEVVNKMYSPCAHGSRFGILLDELKQMDLSKIAGFHIHALCQNNEDSLGRLMASSEEKFAEYFYLDNIKSVNFGGGHMISRPGYDVDVLCNHIIEFQNKYNVQVILEPGEAVVFDAGYLVAEILDIVSNKIKIAILDTSATAHMPDVIEMPYRPNIIAAEEFNKLDHSYRLGGNTCLSGDIIGEYSFDKALKVGQKIIFKDMAQYTMVKNTNFNGIELPKIYINKLNGNLKCVNQFSYDTFKQRL